MTDTTSVTELRVGVFGGGAVGTIVASRLARSGETLLFVRAREDAERISRDGLHVNDDPPQPIVATSDPARASECDVSIVAVKTTATASLAVYAPHLRPGAMVLTLQNGIENDVRVRAALGEAVDVVLGPTMCGGTLVRSGRVRNGRVGPTTIGRLPLAAAHAGVFTSLEPLARRLREAGLPVVLAADIRIAVWSKLIVNGAINALAALCGVPNGGLLEDAALRSEVARLAVEAFAIASATGIDLPFEDPIAHVEAAIVATAANRNSMLQDLEAGRPTEIEALNAAIVRAARAAGLAAPAHEEMTRRIRERDGGAARSSETRGPWPNDA